MKKIEIFRLSMYFLSVALPILVMLNCPEWSTRNMEVSKCYIDFDVCRILANFFWSLVFISAFLFEIPIIIYFAIFIGITKLIVYLFNVKQKNVKIIDDTKEDNKT